MADKKISADATVTPAWADFIPIIQGGTNKKATLTSLPVSTDTTTALWLKVDQTTTVNTKALSWNITLNQDEILDWITYKQYSQTEKTKLAWISWTNTWDQVWDWVTIIWAWTLADPFVSVWWWWWGWTWDVIWPASATDNAIVRFNTTTGKLIQNSSATIDDLWNITSTDIKITDNNLYVWNVLNDEQINGIPSTETAKFTRSYDYSTRTLTLVKVNDWYYYVDWKRFDITADVVFPAHDTTYWTKYFYFDNTWTAITSNTVWNILTTAQVQYTFYNSANADVVKHFTANEEHGVNLSSKAHQYLHLVNGTKFISWGAISWYVIQSSTLANVTYAVATANLKDEDIDIITTAIPDWWPYTVIWRSWAAWEWNWTTTSILPYLIGATPNIQWNEFTGATWQRTEATVDNRYVNYYVVVTNLDTYSYVIVPGQTLYTTLAGAQAESFSQLNLWSSIPFQEFVPLYQVTMRRGWAYLDAIGNARIEATPRTISLPTSGSFSITWSHSALSNLSNDDHLQYQRTCNILSTAVDYTYNGTETRNNCMSVDTTSWNKTITIDPALFSIWTEINIGKPVAANSVIIDTTAWKTINWAQTYTITWQWDVLTLIVISWTLMRTKWRYRDTTPVSSISWTKADFDTACTDWNFTFVWDTATSTNALQSATTTVNVSSAAVPTAWQVLTATSWTAATWQTPSEWWAPAETETSINSKIIRDYWYLDLGMADAEINFANHKSVYTDLMFMWMPRNTNIVFIPWEYFEFDIYVWDLFWRTLPFLYNWVAESNFSANTIYHFKIINWVARRWTESKSTTFYPDLLDYVVRWDWTLGYTLERYPRMISTNWWITPWKIISTYRWYWNISLSKNAWYITDDGYFSVIQLNWNGGIIYRNNILQRINYTALSATATQELWWTEYIRKYYFAIYDGLNTKVYSCPTLDTDISNPLNWTLVFTLTWLKYRLIWHRIYLNFINVTTPSKNIYRYDVDWSLQSTITTPLLTNNVWEKSVSNHYGIVLVDSITNEIYITLDWYSILSRNWVYQMSTWKICIIDSAVYITDPSWHQYFYEHNYN